MLYIRLLEEKDILDTMRLVSKYFKVGKTCKYYDKIKKYSCHGKSLIAILDGQIVGHIFFEEKYSYELDSVYYWLSYVCVDENVRRKKIATNMLKKLEQISLKNHICYIKFTSCNSREDAHFCYLKNGYDKVDTTVFQKNMY